MVRGYNRSTEKFLGPGESAADPSLERSVQVAWKHHRAGRFDDARAIYERIIEQAPRHGHCLHLLGILHYQTERPDLALEFMVRSVAETPLSPILQSYLGEIYRALGRYDEAIEACRRALELKAVLPGALNTLGASLTAKGKVDEAIETLEQAVEFQPNLVEAHANLGLAFHAHGDYDKAVAALHRALEINPGFFSAFAVLGAVRHDQGRPDEAAACFRRVLEARPDDAPTWSKLATTLRSGGKTDEAIDCLRQAIRRRPNFAEGHANLGTMLLYARHQPDEAIACIQDALRIAPNFVEALQAMAGAQMVRGDFEEAARYSRHALKIKPDFMPAHLVLARSGRLASDDHDESSRLESVLERGGLSASDECDLRFALGMAYDQAGRFDEAFHHFQAANERKGVSGRFNFDDFAASIDERIAAFSKDLLDVRQSWGSDSDRPVFIVGMPRSGTTLVEQIAASHPRFFGADELEDLGTIERELSTALNSENPAASTMAVIDEAMARRLAERYLAMLDSLAPDASRVSDKMPSNFLRLGLIALLFPGARVIHCRRNALDLCLSCYFHDFRAAHAYTYDLGELGAYYRNYERLMAHWRDVLPIAMLEIDYENLVADQEAESQRIIEFCGLEWDGACLRFHDSGRAVFTASNWQVRQPIYATSVGRWRNYEAHLDPLKSALGITDMQEGS